MATAHSLRGAGDFDGGTAKWPVLVIGAGDQSEAYDKAAGVAPASYLGVPRGAAGCESHGGGLFTVTFQYAVRTEGVAATPPAGEQPGSGNASPKERQNEPAGTDLSFTLGGGTKRLLSSRKTVFKTGRNQAVAPNFNKLIGYNPKDGSVEGCEIVARDCELTVTKSYAAITYGYLARLLASTASTNKKPFRGMDTGEALFAGADGSFQGGGGEKLPWKISGKFKYSPNWTGDDLKISDEIELPEGTVKGWHYVWSIYEDTTETTAGNTYQVARPKFTFVEMVYEEKDFSVLGMD